jgi:hypothetical protein
LTWFNPKFECKLWAIYKVTNRLIAADLMGSSNACSSAGVAFINGANVGSSDFNICTGKELVK